MATRKPAAQGRSATASATPRAVRAPRLPTRSAWARRTEAQSLALPAALLKEARANTRQAAADVGFLATLAREVALTRGPELTLAFRNLVWVLPGFRKKQGARGARVTSELCVVFVVRRKGSVAQGHPQHLPRWLITFAERDGQRLPFALPTDVQDVADFHGASAHAQSAVSVKNGDWPAAHGSFACVVRLTHDSGEQLCVLSAQHVLTPFADVGAAMPAAGLRVLPLDGAGTPRSAPLLALSLPFGGELRTDERPDRPSFDVQLAAVQDLQAVRQRTASAHLHAAQPWVESMSQLLALDQQGWFYLLPPDNHHQAPGREAVRLTVSAMPVAAVGLAYTFGAAGGEVPRTVYHAQLLRFEAVGTKVPMGGDSGSPIVARRDDGTLTLVAMHIGGNGLGQSWALPAWALFDLRNWLQYPSGARMAPVEP